MARSARSPSSRTPAPQPPSRPAPRGAARAGSPLRGLVEGTRSRVSLLGQVTVLLWAIELIDLGFFRGGFDRYGIEPRTLHGLAGIPLAPFLHGGIAHLASNTVMFCILGFLSTSRQRADFWYVFLTSALVAGLGTWVSGRPGTVHIGASGVVFGFLGFLMGRGFFERRPGAVLLSAAVTALFGGMLSSATPAVAKQGISWEGHFFGWLGGLLVSWVVGQATRGRGRAR